MSTKSPLIAAHAEAIATFEGATPANHPDASVQSLAGIKAAARQKIDLCEMEMEIQGIDYTPWTPPAKSATRKPSVSDGDLMTRIETLTKLAADENRRPAIRATAAKEADRLTAMARKRGLIADEKPADEKPARKVAKSTPAKRTPARTAKSVRTEATFAA